jgi:tetratricopeptide (TPR) repeat protein
LIGIDDVLVRYRVVLGSMSSNVRRMLDHRLLALRKQLGDAPVTGGSSVAHRAYARAYFRGTMEYFQSGDEQNGLACLQTAAGINPELLLDHGIYYELAFSAQGRGDQGSIAGLDLEARQNFLFDVIAQVTSLAENETPQAAGSHAATHQTMQAHALWAIGKLQYERGAYAAARGALLRAAKLDHSVLRSQNFMALLMRTLLTAQQMALLKQVTHRPWSTNP